MDDAVTIGIEKINVILESYMGIYDTELGIQYILSNCILKIQYFFFKIQYLKIFFVFLNNIHRIYLCK